MSRSPRAAQSTATLLRRDWNGTTISRRMTDGYVNATAMCKANGKRWKDYRESDRCQLYLDALESVAGIPVHALVESRSGGAGGGGTWVHPDVATELARWISPSFSVFVNQWFREEVERQQEDSAAAPARQGILPCAVPMAEAIVARRDRNVEVSRLAAALEVPFHEMHNARNVGLTGHKASHWRAVAGCKNWLEKAHWEHQQLHSVANQAGMNAVQRLNPEVSGKDDVVDAMQGAAEDLREYAKKYGMAWQPSFMPHRIGSPRAERVLAAAADSPGQLALLA